MKTMNLKITIVFLLFCSHSFAQKDDEKESRISIVPKFGIGFAVPPFVKNLSGNTTLQPNFQNYIASTLTNSDGTNGTSMKITNLIGVQGSYLLNNGLKTNLGLMRAAHLNMLNDPTIINNERTKWVWGYNYYTLSVGLGKNLGNFNDSRLLQVNLHYTLGFRAGGNNDKSKDNGNFVQNGDGILFTAISENKHPILIAPEYDFRLNQNTNSLFRFSIGALIPLAISGREKATFYLNSNKTGENQITFTQAAVWVKARYIIDIETHKRTKTPQPPKNIPPPTNPKTVVYDGKKVKEGENIVLKALQFEQTKSILGIDGMGELDKVAQLMYGYPNMIIEIVGHTSMEGDRSNNIDLSLKRAKTCKEYLVRKGIPQNHIVVRGMGPDQPISKTDQSQNRRVEMKVIRVN